MRYTCLMLVLAFGVQSDPTSAQPEPDRAAMADSVLAALVEIPVGIRVVHSPDPVAATETSTGRWHYTWKYNTTVSAIDADVTIVEFGVLHNAGDQWTYSAMNGHPYSPKEFEEWYGCTGAVLFKGVPCSDPSNFSASTCLREGKSLWYFIGQTATGQRVKGAAEVAQRAEVAHVVK